MIETLDKCFTSIRGRGKIQATGRFLIRTLSNLFLPLFFIFFSKRKTFKKRCRGTEKRNIVVSLTTFPERIERIWIVLECMFRQTLPPDVIVLYLSDEQFPAGIESLPKRLIEYRNQELVSIRFVKDDLRSHKKYFYSFQEYKESLIILIDDDLVYTKYLVEDLMGLYVKYPQSICCHRAHLVKKSETGELLKYKEWEILRKPIGPSYTIFHTSGGGTIYDPSLFKDDLFNVERIKELCFFADDVWLNIHAYLSGLKTVKSGYFTNYIPILSAGDIKLSDFNVGEGQNDKQIKKTLKFYEISEKDIFDD